MLRRRQTQEAEHLKSTASLLADREAQFGKEVDQFRTAQNEFQEGVISYKNLTDENLILKRDLKNFAVSLRKTKLDQLTQQKAQETLNSRVQVLGKRYLKDSVKWIGASLNVNNFVACKQRLQNNIEQLRGVGFEVTASEEAGYIVDLRTEYELLVRAAFEREEQARIKSQIREEQKLERELQLERERIDREKKLIEAALAKAMAEAKDQYSAEVESLKAKLAEAEANQRAISQAQITKAGYIYVISNIGSFGEGVFKVGMTRRLEPIERVHELSDASVPFPFDIHMMISCDNAPALENALHKALVKQQVNKMNPRKEFFKTDIHTIAELVKEHHGEVHYVVDAEAPQYRQSIAMSDEDMKFIGQVFDEAEEDSPAFDGEASHEIASSY